MISERIGAWVRQYMLHVGAAFARMGVTPNMATLIGLVLNGIVAVILAMGHPVWGGILLLIASAFDMVDGSIARATNQKTKFGGFFDSTIDRYSEIVVYIGLLVWMLNGDDWKLGAILTLVAATGALMISYARARAEALDYSASVGLVARPERVILLALCLLIQRPMWALWILAVLTHITAVWRILHVYQIASKDEGNRIS